MGRHRFLETVSRGERLEQHETVRLRKDGQPVNVSISICPIRDEGGRVVGALRLERDITQLRRIEKSLTNSDLFPEENPNPVMRMTPEGWLLYANKPGLLTLGELGWHTDQPVPAPLGEAARRAFQSNTVELREIPCRSRVIEFSYAPIPAQGYINLYGRDVTQRIQMEAALRESLEEKVVLLKEVHHRVKNNLQVVASLLSLQASHAHDRPVADVLRETRSRVCAMGLLHEALYRSENLARIDFAAYVEELSRQLLRSFGSAAARVTVENRVARIGLSLEQSVPCGLIINELVSNALKHGFPGERAGRVVVELYPAAEKTLVLRVSDDGEGLPAGLEPTKPSTLGLELVSSLAGQLGGELTIDRSEGGGAAFRVVFPMNEDIVEEGQS